MTYQAIEKIKPELAKALEFFQKELMKIRTGQASPSLVEDAQVEAFGQLMPVKQLGAISCPDRRQIIVQPWDHSYLAPIEKALLKMNLGTSPVVDKDVVRITLPQLTQEYRQTLLKMVAEKTEQTHQAMRKWREQAWNEIQEGVRQKSLREDDKFKGKEALQKVVDEYQKKIESAAEKKKQEIQTI